ncbi:hypothetical protein MKW94_015347 [Papaver nudicaule]|uniref:Uncharacterized protein n=1 Tax=Papaver nudicaule TaxID=74823 RepID=A0AA41S4N5_PAPNU|nr:hypothetical protein [Papaver nudicaule]
MTLLGSCWYIVENVLIRDGFEKWYCLVFYINPFFLILSQIFLWFEIVGVWLSYLISQLLKYVWVFSVWVIRFLKVYTIRLISFAKSNNSDVLEIEVTEDYFDAHQQIFDEPNSIIKFQRGTYVAKEVVVAHGNELLQEILDVPAELVCQVLDDEFSPESFSHTDDVDMDLDIDYESLILSCHIVKQEEEIDPFYKKYLERMRWFDLLNQDRTCGINTIFNKQLGCTPGTPLEYIMPREIALPYMSKLDKRKLTRSIESDIEKVYVGQTCLCWEALYHQYRKVEALLNVTNGFFYDNVAGEFQKFQVLLERFVESERPESKRYWNYVEGRFSFKSLLQVPKVSGYFEEQNEELKGESMRAMDVLRAIENSIKAFHIFINTEEDKKPWWKFRKNYPQGVEDPSDLQVVADLTKQLQQKKLLLKGIEGKRKCWLNKNHIYHQQQEVLEELQTTRDILFCTIELKLVSRVLNMALVSTSQIIWCQEKLISTEIEFDEGRVVVKSACRRNCACPLFPP